MVATEPLPVEAAETAPVETAPEEFVPRRAPDHLFQLVSFGLFVGLLVLSVVIWP